MLRLTPFTYRSPATVDEALTMLQEHNAALMGGGTDLLPNIKHRLTSPSYVIGLRNISSMHGITPEINGSVRLGGAVTLTELEHSPLVRNTYPALAEAASLISTPQVRRMGTLGGNICLDVRCNYYNQSEHWRRAVGYCMKKDSEICRVAPGSDRCWAVSSADTVPVLMVLDAQICILSAKGERRVYLSDFYRDDGLVPTTLAAAEIVTGVTLPRPSMSVIYSKLRIRMSFDFPLVGTATGVSLSDDGTVKKARIVVTGVGSRPVVAADAEQLLEGARLTDSVIREAGEMVFRAVHPLDNTEGAIPHRKRMARVYVERALRGLGGLEDRAA